MCGTEQKSKALVHTMGLLSQNTPQTRTLYRAVGVCSDVAALADALSVSIAELSQWLDGTVPVPTDIYLMALDMVAGVSTDLWRQETNYRLTLARRFLGSSSDVKVRSGVRSSHCANRKLTQRAIEALLRLLPGRRRSQR